MKTLNEQINEVMTSNKSRAAKRAELVKIGLRNQDVDFLFYAARQATGETRAQRKKSLAELIKKYTFGVEIECYNAPRTSLLDAARQNGLQMQSEIYNHTDNRRYYKLVSDASIRGDYPVECVSPVLKGDNSGFDSLQACCNALNTIGARVNASTGLHVHIGGQITETQYCNTFANYFYLENVIDTFMAASRRDAFYASALRPNVNRSHVNLSQLLSATTIADIRSAMWHDRYYKINCESWARHKTIEFRQHAGTTNYKKISMWAVFCLKLVAWSADNRLTRHVASIADIPFLTEAEKAYFTSRASELSRVSE